jgi:hypothetical protein
MIKILFQGIFQARFATDPDPYDHPRGQRGWTFSVSGEPDLDRIIRFSGAVAPRSHGRPVGVSVTDVQHDGQSVSGHPLIGAAVNLLDSPKFEGRNGDVAGDGQEPVFPLHFQIAGGNLMLETTEWLAFDDLTMPKGLLRQGQGATADIDPPTLARLLGGLTPPQFRAKRRTDLTKDLAAATDPVEKKALQQRINGIAASPAQDGIKLGILPYRVAYSANIPPGNRIFRDPEHKFQFGDPMQLNWALNWWMGTWDADALSGHIEGSMDLS